MAKNWGCYAQGSKCYDNNPDYCNKYGRLYDWATAMDIDSRYNNEYWNGSDVNHQGICPSGWHIPSDADWDALMTAVGGEETAGKYLKTSVWGGEDKYGFAALPGGYLGGFGTTGWDGCWWSASEGLSTIAQFRGMYFGSDKVVGGYSYRKDFLLSVRCLKD
jgi:uncharacterized protein (TIGR02145 family)